MQILLAWLTVAAKKIATGSFGPKKLTVELFSYLCD